MEKQLSAAYQPDYKEEWIAAWTEVTHALGALNAIRADVQKKLDDESFGTVEPETE